MILETDRLILREYVEEDFDALFEILSDTETMQHYPAPFDEDRTRNWINWNLDNYKKYGFGLWAVVLKETGEFIGDCGITIQDIDGEMLPEIGYHINKKYWRKGFAKEALQLLTDYAFSVLHLRHLVADLTEDNIDSQRLFQSVGFVHTATRKSWFLKENQLIDNHIYQLIKSE